MNLFYIYNINCNLFVIYIHILYFCYFVNYESYLYLLICQLYNSFTEHVTEVVEEEVYSIPVPSTRPPARPPPVSPPTTPPQLPPRRSLPALPGLRLAGVHQGKQIVVTK